MRQWAAAGLIFAVGLAMAQDNLDDYNVVYDSPSKDATGSMPIGNGVVGANVWVDEKTGDVLMYVSRTDSFSEASRLLKLGLVRIKITPNPFLTKEPIEQKLNLRLGRLEIKSGKLWINIYADSTRPVIWIDQGGPNSEKAQVTVESWRKQKKQLLGGELDSSWTMRGSKNPVWEAADTFKIDLVYHRNETTIVPLSLEHQGLSAASASVSDPLLNRSFGIKKFDFGGVSGRGINREMTAIVALCAQTKTAAEFEKMFDKVIPAKEPWDFEPESRTAKWWQTFWNRSYIFVSGDGGLPAVTTNRPLRIGADSGGGNLFRGAMKQQSFFDRALTPTQIKTLSQGQPIDGNLIQKMSIKGNVSAVDNEILFKGGFLESDSIKPGKNGFTCAAFIKPDQPIARIFDQVTAGGSDGWLFDTHPGNCLRLTYGSQQYTVSNVIKQGEWQHVVLTVDNKKGEIVFYVNGKEALRDGSESKVSKVTQAYILQRYMTAIGGRGDYPIKFNGSIFTVEPKAMGYDYNADWRKWGDCFWWQNTRIPYGPMLANGDADLMEGLFKTYERVLPLAKARTKIYHNAEGAYFPETMTLFGTYSNNDYGWDRTGHQPNEVLCPWWQWAWNQGPELVMLMLERYEYTQDREFLKSRALPMARAVLDYFDTRFKRDANGKLRIDPTQAAETYWNGVVNDTPCVAGLHAIVAKLLKAPIKDSKWTQLKLEAFQKSLPEIPIRDGKIAAAEVHPKERSNVENVEFYAIWPFKLFGVGHDKLDVTQKTFRERIEKANSGWQYDGQVAAMAGLTEDAKASLLSKVRNSNPNYRWPATWGPNYDWLPDQDHGGNIMMTLQNMVMQEAEGKIYLLPAFPLDWNVTFKQHASQKTVVTATYRSGKLEKWSVTPKSREKDVVLPKL